MRSVVVAVQGEGRAYSRWPERAPAILDSMLPVKNIFQKDGPLHLRQQVPERAKRAEEKSIDPEKLQAFFK